MALLALLMVLGVHQTPPPLDVTTYGAKGDGVTDDSAALQAAVDACTQGGVVLMPKGQYLVRKPVKLKSSMTLTGVGAGSVVIKGINMIEAIVATDATNLTFEKLKVGVEPTTPAVEKGRLVGFTRCTNVTVTGCTFDGTADEGLPSQESLCQFVTCNDVHCLSNHFNNTAGSATGVTGSSAEPKWGHRSEFAHNVVDNYCDTGIGIWTGASDANIHDNQLHGRAEKFTSFPVGIDVDGGTHSTIANNDIAGGEIAIRLYDVHNGDYPIEQVVVSGNTLHDQLTYDNTHPAWAIKPENPKSRLEATIVGNHIVETAPHNLGIMGGGAGKTTLHIDQNDFSGETFWSFGFYQPDAIEVDSNGQKVDWKTSSGSNTVH